MAAVIKTINLTKRYGSLVALSNLNLEIQEGDCFGFIGPNGAGKTTTIKILATLLQPTWGEARICDLVVGFQSRQIRPLIGYVPDSFGAYEDMVIQEYLEFFAAAYGIHGTARTKIVNDVLELTDLGHKRDALVDALSRGMKQRLSIARVLVHDPKVLLLDEPAGNLDPRARIEMRELLKELRRMGKTILISSHILPELADLCNTVGIIEQGELIYSGPVAEILRRAKTGRVLHIAVSSNTQLAMGLLSADEKIVNVSQIDGFMKVAVQDSVDDVSFIAEKLVQNGFHLTMFKEEEVNLETAFMRLTKGVVQ
jgi:ABC-2 type transport system ATP-binding protein